MGLKSNIINYVNYEHFWVSFHFNVQYKPCCNISAITSKLLMLVKNTCKLWKTKNKRGDCGIGIRELLQISSVALSVSGMTFKCVFSFKGESVCCKYVSIWDYHGRIMAGLCLLWLYTHCKQAVCWAECGRVIAHILEILTVEVLTLYVS